MTPAELFDLIVNALAEVDLDLSAERDRRIYLAYIAARVGQGHDGALEHRLGQLRERFGL